MLLGPYYVPGMIVGARDKVVKGTENQILAFVEFPFLLGWGDRPQAGTAALAALTGSPGHVTP